MAGRFAKGGRIASNRFGYGSLADLHPQVNSKRLHAPPKAAKQRHDGIATGAISFDAPGRGGYSRCGLKPF
jgi:hypothetical protein